MAVTLKITDGSTTVDFLNDAAYRVTSWSPAVATRRVGELGGRGPYGEVVEEMELFIKSGTYQPMRSLALLTALLDQAEQWSRGANVPAVHLVVKMTATSEELRAVITGPPAPGAEMVELPSRYGDTTATVVISPVRLKFKRSGLWLGAESTLNGALATTPQPMYSVAPNVSSYPNALKLRMEGVGQNAAHVYNSFILLSSYATGESPLRIMSGVATAFANPGANFTAVNDAAKKPYEGSNVLRFTASVANTRALSTFVNTSDGVRAPEPRRWGVFLSYRNNSATTGFRVELEMLGSSRGMVGMNVPPGVGNPQYAYLGSVSLTSAVYSMGLWVTPTAGSGSIDFDAVILCAMDSDDSSRVIGLVGDGPKSLSNDDLIIDPRYLSNVSSLVYFDETFDHAVGYRGDMNLFVKGDGIAFAWLATGGYFNPTHWRPSNSGGTVWQSRMYVTSRRSYLTLE